MATEIRFANSAAIEGQVRRAVEVIGHPEPLLKAWGVQVLSWVGQTFREGGRPAWPPLAASTVTGRRQGKGRGSARPLVNTGAYRASFDMRLGQDTVTVFTDSPVAPFHEFGTRGPYEIRPRNAKALALPFLPGRDAGRGSSGSGKAGRFSFAGLGRAKRTAAGGRLVAASGARAGKTVTTATNVAFYQHVTHPGLQKRPVFPTPEQITPALIAVGRKIIAAAFSRRVTSR